MKTASLRPSLQDVYIRPSIFQDPTIVLLDAHCLRSLVVILAAIAASKAWTYSEPRTDGLLPGDDKWFARICGVSPSRWRKKVQPALSQWIEFTDKGARLVDSDAVVVGNLSARFPLPPSVRRAVLKRDGERCVYCGTEEGPFHIDHRSPVTRGGSSDIKNLCVSCLDCNLGKRAKSESEWIEIIRPQQGGE